MTRLRLKALLRSFALASLAGSIVSAAGASAAPLEPEACASLTTERATLVSQGVEGDMSKGAMWARQNLPESRLSQIKRLIEVNEQLSFRCGLMVTARPTLIERVPQPTQAMTTPAGDPDRPQKKQTKSKPKPASAAAPAGTPGAKPKAAQTEPAAPATKPVVEVKTSSAPKAAPPEKQAPRKRQRISFTRPGQEALVFPFGPLWCRSPAISSYQTVLAAKASSCRQFFSLSI